MSRTTRSLGSEAHTSSYYSGSEASKTSTANASSLEPFPEFDDPYAHTNTYNSAANIHINSSASASISSTSSNSSANTASSYSNASISDYNSTAVRGGGYSQTPPTPSAWAPRPDYQFGQGVGNGNGRWGKPPVQSSPYGGNNRQRSTSSSTASHSFAYKPQHHRRSISDALKSIRTRKQSFSQNAHELADALGAPVSGRLITMCLVWWTSSLLTNTSSKSILINFSKPATLTLIQFIYVAFYCVVFSWLAATFPAVQRAVPALRHPLRKPSREVIATTLPMAFFQVGGHLLSSNATSKIPVSLVHTIKGLSPLFTVLAYRILFQIPYPRATYVALVPLTLGVFFACSGNISFGGELIGVVYAFLAAIIFVSQNIYSKRLFNESARAEAEGPASTHGTPKKLDKLNLLCYSSSLAFALTLPIWFWSEGMELLSASMRSTTTTTTTTADPTVASAAPSLFLRFFFNGTFHFGQNIIAFVLLSMVSPVTYSVASLLKRVYIIIASLIWFRIPTTKVQALGITLTFFGLYLYDRANENSKADRRAQSLVQPAAAPGSLLPTIQDEKSPSYHKPRFSGQASAGLLPRLIRSMTEFAGFWGFKMSSRSAGGLRKPSASSYSSRPYPPSAYHHAAGADQPSARSNHSHNHNHNNTVNAANATANANNNGAYARPRGSSFAHASYLMPGTKQEATWIHGDRHANRLSEVAS